MLEQVHAQDADILKFIPEMYKGLNKIKNRNIEDVVEEIMNIKEKFNTLRSHLENSENQKPPDQNFINKFQSFLAENGEKVVFLEEESLRVKEFYFETMVFLGERERRLREKKSKEILKNYVETFSKVFQIYSKLK